MSEQHEIHEHLIELNEFYKFIKQHRDKEEQTLEEAGKLINREKSNYPKSAVGSYRACFFLLIFQRFHP